MRNHQFLFIAAVSLCANAAAAERTWYVTLHGGENMQLIAGAAGTPAVADRQFLDAGFVGKTIYVRTLPGYELAGFRPPEPAQNTAAAASVSASATASASPEADTPTTEFGPIPDSGLQYHQDGDFFGWHCDALFIKPMGNGIDRLRCDEPMRFDH